MIRPGMFIEDRYEILRQIGAGGMSDVYQALDHKLNRSVAIKFLKQEFCEDKNFVSKFQVEAQSAAALLHPNVVSVYDVNEINGIYYIVMEYVDGITLKRYIDRNGRLPVKEATSIAIQIAQGIEAAHNANIIHRDIKPQNVLISREGKIKVTDFGIARTTTANTISQDVLGSVHYISPEQARGGQVDGRSDIYSFGIVFFEMVTGQLPYDGDSTVAIALKHIQENVPLVSDIVPSIPSSVTRIIEKCTQKKPERRYQKMSSLIADLKTSLISPNEDFVVLEPETQDNATILMTGSEAQILREGAGRRSSVQQNYNEPYDDEYDEYDDAYYDDYEYYDDGYDDDEFEPVKGKKGKVEKDPSKKKFDRILLICGIIAGVIILGVLGWVTIRAISSGTGCGGSKQEEAKTVVIENVVGKKEDEARSILEKQGFEVVIKTEESKDVAEGLVISQSEKAGTKVSTAKKITLIVSAGEDTVELPDLKGKTQAEAQEALKKLNLQSKVTNKYSDTVETGKVIDTNPTAKSKVSKSKVIELIISRGPETKEVTVPQCVGSTQAQAEAMLNEAGFKYTIVTQEAAGQGGIVINQSLAAGSSVKQGSEITITVGKEPETTTEEKISVPGVIGKKKEEAIAILQGLGLNPIETQPSNDEQIPEGYVCDQHPRGETMVSKGETIYITISLGPKTD